MAQTDRDLGIARNIQTIEWLKADLISSLAALWRGMLKGTEDVIIESLAGIMVVCYVLARRLGIHFARVDVQVEKKVRMNIDEGHEVEKRYGDLSALMRYLEDRREGIRG